MNGPGHDHYLAAMWPSKLWRCVVLLAIQCALAIPLESIVDCQPPEDSALVQELRSKMQDLAALASSDAQLRFHCANGSQPATEIAVELSTRGRSAVVTFADFEQQVLLDAYLYTAGGAGDADGCPQLQVSYSLGAEQRLALQEPPGFVAFDSFDERIRAALSVASQHSWTRLVLLTDVFVAPPARPHLRPCANGVPNPCIADIVRLARPPGAAELEGHARRLRGQGWAAYLVEASHVWMLRAVRGLMRALGQGGRAIAWLVVMDRLLDETWFFEPPEGGALWVMAPETPAALRSQYGLAAAVRVAQARDALQTAAALLFHGGGCPWAAPARGLAAHFRGDTGVVNVTAGGRRVQQGFAWYHAAPPHGLRRLTLPSTGGAAPGPGALPDGLPYEVPLLFLADPFWPPGGEVMAAVAAHFNTQPRAVLPGRTVRIVDALPPRDPGLVVGCIGPMISTTAIMLTAAIGFTYGVPQLSIATTDVMSDKTVFPLFARMMPPDLQQGDFLLNLLRHFSWTPVCIVQDMVQVPSLPPASGRRTPFR